MSQLKAMAITFLFSLVSQQVLAIDMECKFSGEKKLTVFTDLVFGENIAYVGGKEDAIRKREIYWGDDYLTIIIETTGMATLVVVNRNDWSATKRITRAGISRGEARGWCRMLKQEEK